MTNFFARLKGALAPIFRALSPVMFAIQSVVAIVAIMFYPVLMGIVSILFIVAFRGGPAQFALWISVFFGLTILMVVTSQIKTKWLARATTLFFIALQVVILVVITNMALKREFQVWINFWAIILCTAFIGGQINLWWLIRHYGEVWAGAKTFFARLIAWLLSWLRRGAAPVATPAAALGAPAAPAPIPGGPPGLPTGAP